MQVEVRELPPRRAVCMAHSGPYFMIGQTFDRLMRWMREQDVPFGPQVALYYDDPDTTPASELHADAGVLVPDDFVCTDPAVHSLAIAGGLYAVGTHVGPYDGLPHAWSDLLAKWLPASGYTFGDAPGYELYINNCTEGAPDALRTEICVPVRVPLPSASDIEGEHP
jgi:AraC family transcriptional regulator